MAGAAPVQPTFLPKAALTTSRLVYKPFLIPEKLTVSSTNVGQAVHSAVGGINASIGTAYAKLEPKGPAKWMLPLFQRVDGAVASSAQKADRNREVFWEPFSEGSAQIGQAVAGPGAYYYLKRIGYADPSNKDVIRGVLRMKLRDFPTADQLPSPEQIEAMKQGGAPAPGPAQPQAPAAPPAGATEGAAEGAGQAQGPPPQAQPAA